MKKILLLGGSAQQIIAIETAKKLGYYTVLCDYLTDNPGQHISDKFYLLSTTDKEAILKVAQEEKISGILAYASDPAAPTAAYVAEKLRLPGNPYESVEILCNKDKFRKFLSENGFNTPKAKGYKDIKEAEKDIFSDCFRFPVIVKPVDSSGSKGATVLYDSKNITEALKFAFSFSRCKSIIIEEFIEKKHKYLVGGDIFISDEQIILWGLMNCHRDNKVNNLVPVGKSYPVVIDNEDMENIKLTLKKIVEKLNIKNGAMNVELIVDKNGNVYPIDIGPRSGGNMIPDLLGYIFNTDIVEMSIKKAMGELISRIPQYKEYFYATYNLHCNKNGVFKDIHFSDEINNFIIKKCVYKKTGDIIEYFDNASKVIGIIFMKFDTMEQMLDVMDNSENWIEVKLK